MKARTRYTDGPIGPIKVVPDFLPPPEQLVFKQDAAKITISLSKHSIAFFKAEAARNRTSYQRMIRRLLDLYVVQAETSKKRSRGKRKAG
jgi:hypothetical protein